MQINIKLTNMKLINRKSWQSALVLLFLAFFTAVVFSSAAFAQYDTGSINGIVRDKTGAVVGGADVKVTSAKNGRVIAVTTGDGGEYNVPGLPEGTYTVEASHAGFATETVSNVVLHASETRAANIELKVGAATENVTVTADTFAVNTETSESGGTINGTQVENLPLNGRDFTSLIELVPGSITSAGFGGTSLGGSETSYAGVNVLLDGADANRVDSQAVSTQLGRQESRINRASVDSIAEFEVLSGVYSAEYGDSSGSIVNVITKSGSNALHGGVFEFFRNDVFDAENYFQTGKAPFRLNQFGGNLGGPIVHDKLFFFVNYEAVRQATDSPTGPVIVMTAATRAMAVSQMQPVVNAEPLPNPALGPVITPDGTIRTDLGYFEGSLFDTLREDTGSAKLDYNASPKDSFSFRYNISDSFTNTEYGPALYQVSPSPGRNYFLKGTYNRIISPNLLNEFGVAFNRPSTDSFGGGGPFPFFQCSALLGCTADNGFGAAPGPDLFSEHRPQHSLQFLDTLSWTKGRHAIRAGLNIRHAVTHDALIPQDFIAYDSQSDYLANQGWQFSTLGHNVVGLENTNYGFFIQDDIRVTPRFTLNLGLRYDYFSVLHGDLMQNFDIPTLTFGPLGGGLYHPDRNDFGPRLGFAWDPHGDGKTVIRGGGGVFYNPSLTGEALSLAGNYQQGYNVSIFTLLGFFGPPIVCTPPFGNPYYYINYPLPNPLPTCTPAPPPNVDALDPHLRDSYSLHWSLGVQHQLARDTIMEISYVGARGLKLPAGAAYAGEELNLSPFGGPNEISPNFGNIRFLGDYVESNYHSLQASLRRHLSHGLTLDANYTWAHETDDGADILLAAYQNSHDIKQDYASGDIDVRHNFTMGAVWDVPTMTSVPSLLGKGWQLNSIISARSGLPVNIAVASPFLGIDQIRPDLVPGQSIRPSNYSVPLNQFNFNAFAIPPAGELGDLGRNAGRGPGFAQIDLGLTKTAQITEHLNAQLGAQCFNIANHPNFANPDGNLEDFTFGQTTSTVGNKVGLGTARQFQIFAKFTF
jgi:outer membrane receptor protein involved in Fe transport